MLQIDGGGKHLCQAYILQIDGNAWGSGKVKVKVKVKVTSLYMPQRASQRKLGKSLQPNLSKQKGFR